MAKSKSRSSATTAEKKPTNRIMQQLYAVRTEIRKVTWPTREEARALTIAVTVITVVIAIFLFLIDLLFETVIITGFVGLNVAWIAAGAIALVLLGLAFYVNGREV